MTAGEIVLQYIAFIAAMMAFSYAFYQKGWWFIIPEGIYIGAFTALSLMQIYKSFRGMAWDYILAG
jgi:hypothetical protein